MSAGVRSDRLPHIHATRPAACGAAMEVPSRKPVEPGPVNEKTCVPMAPTVPPTLLDPFKQAGTGRDAEGDAISRFSTTSPFSSGGTGAVDRAGERNAGNC